MPRNASADALRALDVALSEADRELHAAAVQLLPDGPGRDYLLGLIRTPNARRVTLEPNTKPSTAASRWRRAKMPRVCEIRVRINAHRARRLDATGYCRSVDVIAVQLGMVAQHLNRHLRPVAGPRLRAWLAGGTPADTLRDWVAFLGAHREAFARYVPAPPLPAPAADVLALRHQERRLERDLARVRAALSSHRAA